MKFAIPLAEGKLTAHFGHCREFALVEVEDAKIKTKETLEPPPHEPGALPRWLHEIGTDVIIAGGMGARALDLFAQNGIKVLSMRNKSNRLEQLFMDLVQGETDR